MSRETGTEAVLVLATLVDAIQIEPLYFSDVTQGGLRQVVSIVVANSFT
jgi:hypothetical protein